MTVVGRGDQQRLRRHAVLRGGNADRAHAVRVNVVLARHLEKHGERVNKKLFDAISSV